MRRIRVMLDMLNWSDVLFFVSGTFFGFATIVTWNIFDPLANWDFLSIIVSIIWTIGAAWVFKMAVEWKILNK